MGMTERYYPHISSTIKLQAQPRTSVYAAVAEQQSGGVYGRWHINLLRHSGLQRPFWYLDTAKSTQANS